MKGTSNQLMILWDMKRKQLRLSAGGTVGVICVVIGVIAYVVIRRYF
jgi:hypothetical protein